MKPRKNYRERPKKTGAKKKQRVLSQKKRLVAAGCDEKDLKKKSIVEIRDLIKKAARKKSVKPAVKAAGKAAKAPAKKKQA
jgi:hypothetical protein